MYIYRYGGYAAPYINFIQYVIMISFLPVIDMIFTLKFIAIYLLGGFTFIPFTLIALYLYFFVHKNKSKVELSNDDTKTGYLLYKVGWLQVSRNEEEQGTPESIGDIVKNYISGKSKRENVNVYFSVLKYNTLYLYESEKQLDCKGVINLCKYSVKMHPPGLEDFELFSKPHLIKLEGKENEYYVNCHKCIEKEDWYFIFLRASRYTSSTQKEVSDRTCFIQTDMNHLINRVHSDEHHYQTQWFNAILGRIFLSTYRTQDIKETLYKKVITKLDRINAKRPPFLGEITVRSVDPGHSLPRFTQPKLLSLSPSGELLAEAHMQYDGGFRIEIETVLKWKYSDILRPLTIDLVLDITLKEIQGKMLMKIKKPPTNRFWYAFYECPKMEWKVEPVVWEKRVGYSMVVKAIETKIQEFIMETMVLPYYDDIVFFPTDGVGGIFEDTQQQQGTNEKDRTPAMTIIENNKNRKENKDRHKEDEALLRTAKSLPELFSAMPDRQQQLS
ncbi:MAG: putative integral membrane protein conserved region-domain-containing protein, partial [Benjaminiella poitrasii]